MHRNDQTARNGLSFMDMSKLCGAYKVQIAEYPLVVASYVRPMSFGVTLLPGSVQSNSEF